MSSPVQADTLPEQTAPSLYDLVDNLVEQKLKALGILPDDDEDEDD